jgi:hypothetical protein
MTNKRVVFTILFGDYESLNELEVNRESNVDYIAFTDSDQVKSESWQVRRIMPRFKADSVRSQRLAKLSPPLIREEYEQSLYVDNTVKLKAPVNKILDSLLKDSVCTIPAHSHRDTLRQEFEVVLAANLDSRERIEEQFQHYEEFNPQILDEKPYWTGIIARSHGDELKKLENIWADHILRYSRRDQLSLNIAAQESGLQIRKLDIDNFESEFHQWPIYNERDGAKRVNLIPDFKNIAEAKSQELDLISDELFRTRLKLSQVYSSKSWKVTRPLRNVESQILKLLRRFKSN